MSVIFGLALGACLRPPAPETKTAATTPSAVSKAKVGNTAAAGAYKWRSVTILGGGYVTGVEFSPVTKDIVYARTDVGGAYRLEPKDGSWIPLTDFFGRDDEGYLGIESIAPDPIEPNRVYMAVGTYVQSWAPHGAFMRSEDQGKTWEVIPTRELKMGGNENGRGNGERLAVDPNDNHILYFGSRRWGLWKSVDRASTWHPAASFPLKDDPESLGIPFVVFDKSSGVAGKATPVIYAGASRKDTNLYRSKDAGATWEAVPKQPTGMLPNHAELDRTGVMYLSYASGAGPSDAQDGAVFKFDTKKEQWTDITPLKPRGTLPGGVTDSFGYGALSLDAQHPGTVLTATLDRWSTGGEMFRTRDAGQHWEAIAKSAKFDAGEAKYTIYPGHEDTNPVQWVGGLGIDPFNADRAFLTTGGGVWGTENLTAADKKQSTSWKFQNKNLEEACLTELASPPEGPPLLSASLDLCGFYHKDIDVSPEHFTDPLCASGTGLDFAHMKPNVVVRSGSHPWVGPKSPRGAISFDFGHTWKQFATEPSRSDGSGTITVSADGSTIVWSSRATRVARSTDNGKSWVFVDGLPEASKIPDWASWHIRLAADAVNPKKIYAYDTLGGTAYTSVDAGAHFTKASGSINSLPEYNLTVGSIRTVLGFEGHVWLTTGSSLMHSTDSGKTYSVVSAVKEAYAVGFGKAAQGQSYPAIYLSGKVGDVVGYFRSDDGGANFERINDDAHQFGGSNLLIGDPRIYGRVYVAGHGRGVFVGEPK